MKTVVLGLVGAGRWGHRYIDTLGRLDGCRLVGVVDTDPHARSDVFREYRLPAFATVDDLVHTTDASAVVVASPPDSHGAIARQALQLDLDVLVEKPMALDVDEALLMVDIAEARRRILAVGHTAMHQVSYGELRQRLADGRLSPPVKATAVRTSSGPGRHATDVLWDLASHDVAMMIALLGRPAGAHLLSLDASSASYRLDFGCGSTLEGHARWSTEEPTREFRVSSDTAAMAWSEDSSVPVRPEEQPLARQCGDFIRACRNRQRPMSDGRLGLEVTLCLHALARPNSTESSRRHNGALSR